MPKNRKKEMIISSCNWQTLETIAARIDSIRYLLFLCLNDVENTNVRDLSSRSEFMWDCVSLLSTLCTDVLTLQESIRVGVDFK